MATHNDHELGQQAADGRAKKLAPNSQVVEFDRYIDDQLRKTRSRVRTVDVAGSLMLLAAGTLAYGFVAAIFDHWVVTGGLGFWGRSLFLAVFVVGAAGYLATQMLPLVLHSINPVYAAQAIERSRPSLKNALVNFLFFRADPAGLNPVVYQAVEEQAATNLAKAQVDSAVDRTKLIKFGYALTAILLVCAVYALVSPKDLFKSVGRIAMPWAEIGAPTRTTIDEIAPRSTQAFRGQQIAVSALIRGLPADGKARLFYSTADGQIVDRPLEMVVGSDDDRHACVLPGGDGSLQQDVMYRIEAGDAISPEFRIEVVAAPTIFVRAVEYKYPPYTRLVDQRVEGQGDLKGIEGTQVTIEATANGDIETAQVDFDCDGQADQRMQTEGAAAKSVFRLALGEDRKTPWHSSYQLVFKNAQGQQNPQPVRHQIEVTRDVPPEIVFVAPKKDEVDLPLNATLVWEIVANDPDFGLRLVKLSATKGQLPLIDTLLLDEERRGQFVARYRFEPSKLELKAGDVVEYWAVAEDNKDPRPNRVETARRRVRIVSPDARQGGDDQLASNQKSGERRNQPGDQGQRGDNDRQRSDDPEADRNPDQQPPEGADQRPDKARDSDDRQRPDEHDRSAQQPGGDQQGDQQPQSEQQNGDRQGEGDQGPGKSAQERAGDRSGKAGDREAAERRVSSDGTNDGDAIERILKHRDEQNKDQQPPDAKRQGERSGQQQRPGDKQGEKQPGEKQSGDKQPGDDRQQRQPSGDKGDEAADRDSSQQQRAKPDAPGEQQDKRGGQQDGSGGQQDKSGGQQDKRGEKGQRGQQRQGGQEGSQPNGDKQPSADERGKSAGDKDSKPDGASDGRSDKPQSDRGTSGEKGAREGATSEGKKDGQPNAGENPQTADEAKPSADKSNGADKDNQKPDPRGGATRENTTPDKSRPDGQPTEGQGAQSRDDPTSGTREKPRDPQRPDAKGGDSLRDKGQSGAGQKSQDQQGSPSPMESSQPRKKSQPSSTGDDDPKDSNQAQSASSDKRESDSQGQDDGDRSGGGKRGGGQKANKPGTGGAGQNTAADEGAGTSNERGSGEDSERAGRDREADKPTGQGGSKPGDGSGTRPSSGEAGKPGSDSASDSKHESAGDKPTGAAGKAGGGQPTGGQPGGQADDRRPPDGPFKPGEEVADEANLEYARKATDLALAHLKDELKKDRPDPALLERLGWTRKDLENFVKRWEAMRRAAQVPGERGTAAERELDETLRSLGLRPRATSRRGDAGRDDQFKGLRESRRTSPPPEYDEQTKAYTQGTARGGK